ncbi:MAG: hypothetical protein SOZ59_02245 [Candidatus Limivivens sp.]|nr:hypothetical protein [Candidatus Limivivens sp.]
MKKRISLLLVFLLLALSPCTVFAETITREEFAAMQSLPELYRKYGSVMCTYALSESGSDAECLEWVWYSETEEQKPVLGCFDEVPLLAHDGFTYGYNEEGILTAWLWLSGWEEALEKSLEPLMELPEEKMELITEEDGSYSLIYESYEESSGGCKIYGSLDDQKNISSIIRLQYTEDSQVQEILTFCPMANPLVSLDMDELMQNGTRQITYIRQDGTEQTVEVPQLLQIEWIKDGETCQAYLDPECTEPIMYLPAGSEAVTVYEGKAE